MSIISSITVTALTVMSSISTNHIPEVHNTHYDPLGYTQTSTEYSTYSEYDYYVDNRVSLNKTMQYSNVTVLTHGMGGNAEHWLFEDQLQSNVYWKTDFSLPFVLCNSPLRRDDNNFPLDYQEDIIYKFEYDYDKVILSKLYPIGNDKFEFYPVQDINPNDVNKHIVLIYEGEMGSDNNPITNEGAYNLFRTALNTVLTGISQHQQGYLPGVNLIGHSRGGIINLLYASKYPTIVNNLISLGTPYMGSQWAEVYVAFNKLVHGSNNFTGYDDLLSPSHREEYQNKLNSIYQQVNSYAIGFGQTNSYLANSILTYFTGDPNLIDNLAQQISEFSGLSVVDSRTLIDNVIWLLQNLVSFIVGDTIVGDMIDATAVSLAILDSLSENEIIENLSNLINNFSQALKYDVLLDGNHNLTYIETDLAVNLDSQLGLFRNSNTPFYNFKKRDTIILGQGANTYYSYPFCTSPNEPWIAHNFETKNPVAINYILNFLNTNDGFHEHNYLFTSTDTSHYSYCDCGVYRIPVRGHSFAYEYRDEATHNYYCSHSECHYLNILPHNFEYEYIDEYKHYKECIDCGYSYEKEHIFDQYVPLNGYQHMSKCECGLEGNISNHSIGVIGFCSYCGYREFEPPIVDPDLPPLEPLPIE